VRHARTHARARACARTRASTRGAFAYSTANSLLFCLSSSASLRANQHSQRKPRSHALKTSHWTSQPAVLPLSARFGVHRPLPPTSSPSLPPAFAVALALALNRSLGRSDLLVSVDAHPRYLYRSLCIESCARFSSASSASPSPSTYSTASSTALILLSLRYCNNYAFTPDPMLHVSSFLDIQPFPCQF